MRIQGFDEMLAAYNIARLDTDDANEREKQLLTHRYSFIVELGFAELDALDKWIETNLGAGLATWIFYGKTEYNFGFAEYFFSNEQQAKAVKKVVPNIYTTYPHSYPPGQVVKSNGYDEEVVYDSADENAIVIDAWKD